MSLRLFYVKYIKCTKYSVFSSNYFIIPIFSMLLRIFYHPDFSKATKTYINPVPDLVHILIYIYIVRGRRFYGKIRVEHKIKTLADFERKSYERIHYLCPGSEPSRDGAKPCKARKKHHRNQNHGCGGACQTRAYDLRNIRHGKISHPRGGTRPYIHLHEGRSLLWLGIFCGRGKLCCGAKHPQNANRISWRGSGSQGKSQKRRVSRQERSDHTYLRKIFRSSERG